MPTGLAARILGPVTQPLPGDLQPGPGSFNVIIGGRVAWRGVSAAAGTPGDLAAKAAAAASMGSMISGAAGEADIHICATPLPVPPHGPDLVVDGAKTVLISGSCACRVGEPAVIIGG